MKKVFVKHITHFFILKNVSYCTSWPFRRLFILNFKIIGGVHVLLKCEFIKFFSKFPWVSFILDVFYLLPYLWGFIKIQS